MIASCSPILWLFILINIFISSPLYASIYDIDQNDIEDALTDGLLIIRHEFGIEGANLTDGALAPNAALTNSESIASYINDRSMLFDLDGNGSNDALTDGLLLLRYLFGISGASLIQDAIGPGATRNNYAEIKAHIDRSNRREFKSIKRGIAYGMGGGQPALSMDDLGALSGGLKWWYNWRRTPNNSIESSYSKDGFDFVPMAWGRNFNDAEIRNYLNDHPQVKYLLGFNEPNFQSQANMTPAQAAAEWPRLEAIAQEYGLELVSPAVNFSPGDVDIPGTEDDGSPWAYLDAFFEECDGCQVDHIAVHGYMPSANAFKAYIEKFERYGKPIWVTEWAAIDGGGAPNLQSQMSFLSDTTRWLENNDSVFRYSWFIARSRQGYGQAPFNDILTDNGSLAPLGEIYTSIPSNDYVYIPEEIIEAEGAHQIQGFVFDQVPVEQTENFSHSEVKITSQNNSAYVEYKIYIEFAGNYYLNLRLSSPTTNTLQVDVNNRNLWSLNLWNTTSDDPWKTFSSDRVFFDKGNHVVRVYSDGAFAFNWFKISKTSIN